MRGRVGQSPVGGSLADTKVANLNPPLLLGRFLYDEEVLYPSNQQVLEKKIKKKRVGDGGTYCWLQVSVNKVTPMHESKSFGHLRCDPLGLVL